MKIALITEYTEIGGGESNLLNLAEELSKTNNVTIFCSGKIEIEAKKRNLETVYFRAGKRWVKFVPILCFKKSLIVQLNKFDIVHAYSLNVLPYLFGVKSKIVWTTHGYWERPNGFRSKIIDKIVDKVVCVSTDVYNIANFDIEKKQIVYLGTNFKISENLVDKRFDNRHINLVCVGRFQKIKGQDILIEALERLLMMQVNMKLNLFIVGDVNGNNQEDMNYKKSLFDKVNSIKNKNLNIEFLGFQRNVREFIEKADIVVIPSRYESFSMIAIEALSCGKPIIAPNIGGPKDIVNSDEVGLLFEAGNVKSLTQTIHKMIKNFESFDPQLALQRAKFFNIENQTKNHLALYEELLND